MSLDRRLCVAPMMDWTDRHCRYFHRLLAPRALLYTEMITTGAILHGDQDRFLAFHPSERPLALQVGGSDPQELAQCAEIAMARGFDEINLNVGCPSDRVQSGRFGACLMREPERVRDSLAAMAEACSLPVTVKHRLGVDEQDVDVDLESFVQTVRESGCEVFVVHARKAWLEGLDPKQNREIPPLDYARVYRLKAEHPELTVVINGGIDSARAVQNHLKRVDGVMLGRAAYQNPYLLAAIHAELFEAAEPADRGSYVDALRPYIRTQLDAGTPLARMTRHILGLYREVRGAKQWRRTLSELAHRQEAGVEVLDKAASAVR